MSSDQLKHPFGQSVSILDFDNETGKVIANKEDIDRLFLRDEVKNRKIVVLSIIGAFRKGKSFFLDYVLRYMYANYSSISNPKVIAEGSKNDWMGVDKDPLQGFSWKSGTTRVTAGVMVWSDFFLFTKDTTGEEIAIVIMDTQGLFDNKTSTAQNSSIFSLGTLISSIQILNLFSIVQEDHLQYLQFATEYSRFATQDNSSSKPFQKLMFLIRDWNNPDDYKFGLEGGKAFLEKVLRIEPQQKAELKSVRKYISASFEELTCCLLPYPGKNVATNKKYDGNWKMMDEDFKEELQLLIEHLAFQDNLTIKTINGKEINGAEMSQLIVKYFVLFQSDKLPKAQSIYESTIEQQMNVLIEECLSSYKQNIFENQRIVTVETIHAFHELCKSQTLLHFMSEKKMGNKEHEKKFKNLLEQGMDKLFILWKAQTVQSLEQIAAEKLKTEEAIKEKVKQEEKTRKAIEENKAKQVEIQKALDEKRIQKLEYDIDMEKVKARLEAEKVRLESYAKAKKESDDLQKRFMKIQEENDKKRETAHQTDLKERENQHARLIDAINKDRAQRGGTHASGGGGCGIL